MGDLAAVIAVVALAATRYSMSRAARAARVRDGRRARVRGAEETVHVFDEQDGGEADQCGADERGRPGMRCAAGDVMVGKLTSWHDGVHHHGGGRLARDRVMRALPCLGRCDGWTGSGSLVVMAGRGGRGIYGHGCFIGNSPCNRRCSRCTKVSCAAKEQCMSLCQCTM